MQAIQFQHRETLAGDCIIFQFGAFEAAPQFAVDFDVFVNG